MRKSLNQTNYIVSVNSWPQGPLLITQTLLFFFCFTIFAKKLNYVKNNCSPRILWKDKKVDLNEYLGVRSNFRLGNLVAMLGVPRHLNLAVPRLRFMKLGPSTAQEVPYYYSMHSFLKLSKGTENGKRSQGKAWPLNISSWSYTILHKTVRSDKERWNNLWNLGD